MIDNIHQNGGSSGSSVPPESSSGSAGFCQECGRALTTATVRRVGGGVFCPPCASHQAPTTGWQAVHASSPPQGGRPYTPRAGEPNPVLAGFFGAIPGVGAMYNGQYAKGAMHLLIFVVLVTLADNLNWVLWWLVWGWVFYQIFEAYHTARARRDHLPLPNAFGWNDLGERLGFQHPVPPVPPTETPFAATETSSRSPWAAYSAPTEPTPAPSYADPAYNPYTGPGGVRPPVVPISPQPATNIPYAPTYTGQAPGQPSVPASAVSAGAARFPVGALWLIGLGGLFLVGNVMPAWRLSGRWVAPVFLAAVAAWSAFRRWEQFHATPLTAGAGTSLAGAMAGPVLFGTVAALLAFQAAHLFSLRRSWPVLLVIWGGMLLLRRSAPARLPLQPTAVPDPVAPPVRSTSGTGSYGL